MRMKLLVIGGSVFVGWHLVSEARARGHQVTMFNRGRSDPDAFAGVEQVRGDRATDDIQALAGRRWDAVIDTCGYDPVVVGASARLLADAVDRYVFLSSLAVYRDRSTAGQDESSPLVDLDDTPQRGAAADHRLFPEAPGPGPSKLQCEQAVEAALPGRALHFRLGLMSGLRDASDRFPYWPWRIARGGDILAPGRPSAPIQVMHGQDFARFAMDLLEKGETGVYNAAGPERALGAILDACREVTGGSATFHWVDDELLVANGMKMYVDLPLWVTRRFAGVNQYSIDKALAAGLHHRPLEELIRDTVAWLDTRPADYQWKAGLAPEREAELIGLWRARREVVR